MPKRRKRAEIHPTVQAMRKLGWDVRMTLNDDHPEDAKSTVTFKADHVVTGERREVKGPFPGHEALKELAGQLGVDYVEP